MRISRFPLGSWSALGFSLLFMAPAVIATPSPSADINKARKRYDSSGAGAAALVAYDACKKARLEGSSCVQAAAYFALDNQVGVVGDLIESLELGAWDGVAFANVAPDAKLTFERDLLRAYIDDVGIPDEAGAKLAYLLGIDDLWLGAVKGALAAGKPLSTALWQAFVVACREPAPSAAVSGLLLTLKPAQGLTLNLKDAAPDLALDATFRFGGCEARLQDGVLVLPPKGYTGPMELRLSGELRELVMPLTARSDGGAEPPALWEAMKRSQSNPNNYTYMFDFQPLSSSMAARCQEDRGRAQEIFARAGSTGLLVVSMPYFTQGVRADFFGCQLVSDQGTLAVPYEGWPENQVVLTFGAHEVRLSSPGRPTKLTLKPSDYPWMHGTVVLRHVPEGFTVWQETTPVPCTWAENRGTCEVWPGPFVAEVTAPGRVREKIEMSVAPEEAVEAEVRLTRDGWLNLSWPDLAATGGALVGAGLIASGVGVVLGKQQELKDTPGTLAVGTVEGIRSAESLGNGVTMAGGALLATGVVVEAGLLLMDRLSADSLPEWQE